MGYVDGKFIGHVKDHEGTRAEHHRHIKELEQYRKNVAPARIGPNRKRRRTKGLAFGEYV